MTRFRHFFSFIGALLFLAPAAALAQPGQFHRGACTSSNCTANKFTVGSGGVCFANGTCQLTAASDGGTPLVTIQEEGAPLPERAKLNFVGPTTTAADDAVNARTNVTIVASGTGTCAAGTVANALNNGAAPGCITPPDLSCVGCVSDGELASNYSGVGPCPAGEFVTATNDNAAPTCAAPPASTETGQKHFVNESAWWRARPNYGTATMWSDGDGTSTSFATSGTCHAKERLGGRDWLRMTLGGNAACGLLISTAPGHITHLDLEPCLTFRQRMPSPLPTGSRHQIGLTSTGNGNQGFSGPGAFLRYYPNQNANVQCCAANNLGGETCSNHFAPTATSEFVTKVCMTSTAVTCTTGATTTTITTTLPTADSYGPRAWIDFDTATGQIYLGAMQLEHR